MLQPLINDFLSLIYPSCCPACQNLLMKHESLICNTCLLTLPRLKNNPVQEQQLEHTFAGRVTLHHSGALFAFEKSGRVQKLLHTIKYKQHRLLASYLGQMMGVEWYENRGLSGIDYVVPVPLHPKKLRARGFNQSEYIGKGLAQSLGAELVSNGLMRQTETKTQTRKFQFERWENVKDVFVINPLKSELFKGKHILLVDDVITTGATIEAACIALQSVPDIRLSIIALAYALKA